MGAMMAGLGQRLAHQGAGADHAIEARHGDHLDDGRHATAFFADHPGQGAAELDFAGRVGAIAEFVFQTLDIELVARVVRTVPRQ